LIINKLILKVLKTLHYKATMKVMMKMIKK